MADRGSDDQDALLRKPVAATAEAVDTAAPTSPGSADPRPAVLPRILEGRGFPIISVILLCIYLLLAAPAGAYGAIKFFNKLKFADFHPTPGTVLYATNDFLHEWFGYFWMTPMYVQVQSVPPGDPLNEGARAAEMWAFNAYMADALQSPEAPTYWYTSIRGYYLPGHANETLVGGTNNDTMVLAIDYARGSLKGGVKEMLFGVVDAFFSTVRADLKSQYTVRISGVAMLNDAMGEHVLQNMAVIDAIAIPTGLAMFCWAVRSPFAVIVPIAVILCSLTTALGWGEVLKHHMEVTGFAPELMATTVIALSIDFSLFVVSRLREFHLDPEVRERFAPRELLWMAYSHTAHNIFVSGIAIAGAFGGLAFIKTDFVRSIALLCMIGTLMTLLAALVLIPSVLCFLYPFCFDNCCSRAIDRCADDRRRRSELQQSQDTGAGADASLRSSTAFSRHSGYDGCAAAGVAEPLTPDNDSHAARSDSGVNAHPIQPMTTVAMPSDDVAAAGAAKGPHVAYLPDMELSMWGRAAAFSARRPWAVLGVALLAMIFPLYNICAHFAYDDNYFASAPYTSQSWRDYAEILGNFQRQVDTPLTVFVATIRDPLLAEAGEPAVLSERNWEFMIEAVRAVLDSPLPVGGLTYIDAPCVLDGEIITFTQAKHYINASLAGNPPGGTAAPRVARTHSITRTASLPSPYTPEDAAKGLRLRELLKFLANNLRLSQQFDDTPVWPTSPMVAIRLRMPGSTWGRFGAGYLDQLHAVMHDRILPARDALADPGTFVGYMGANADSWAVMRQVMNEFVLVIGITAAMLVATILVLFRSVFFAAKMLLTMAYTVIFSFGMNITLYHYGWFRGAWFALDHVDKYFWLIAVIGFSVCCVLSLDYDVFLIIRVLEFRQHHGFTDRQAVVHAVSRSGPVISYAALIMMIAFGALIFADTVMMSQFGLTLTLAVFLDAFVVRPLLVPALIAATPARAIWFPRRMPEPRFQDLLDYAAVAGAGPPSTAASD